MIVIGAVEGVVHDSRARAGWPGSPTRDLAAAGRRRRCAWSDEYNRTFRQLSVGGAVLEPDRDRDGVHDGRTHRVLSRPRAAGPPRSGSAALAVELAHLRLRVAVADGRVGRHRLLDPRRCRRRRGRARAPPAPRPAARAFARRSAARCPRRATAPRRSPPARRVAPRSSATRSERVDERQVALQVLALKARRPAAEVGAGGAAVGRPVAADQAAREHAVGGDRDPELAAGPAGSRARSRARSASTRSAGRRSDAPRRRGGSCPGRPPTGRCSGRSRPAPSRRSPRSSPRSAPAGSSRAGR